ncbi:NRAMP family divalent metal transporter [uncultured Caulobacter sp.]|uniref:NRAMP family divalent metal transporter n=1 Tax=uncultured Caulobacter sp. TaxID=158749 RepID=UPI002637F713|nr:divalent metal cation transporter [uncultured Caulobacter sp.]
MSLRPPPNLRGRVRLASRLGPGLITGAADDDPSGIATYSQAGARFGLDMLWTVIFTYPLMVAVQLISARIGRVTGAGLSSNLVRVFPRWVVTGLVCLLLIANIVNIGADLAAMGAAANLVFGGDRALYTLALAAVSLLLQLFVPYHRYVRFLKWLTMALFVYVGVIFTIHIDWLEVLARTTLPRLELSGATITMVVAVFGTTISPYLFFWQSAEEVEDMEAAHAPDLLHAGALRARAELDRIRTDTLVGMGVSNAIAFFIILTTAVTLHAAGRSDIQTTEEAALALRPIAGPLAFVLFSAGVVGTGLLAAPVLAGSAAYAVAEARGWTTGLEHPPWRAKGFYAVITLAMLAGLAITVLPIDPIKALFWSAVLNGVISVPIMAAMMRVATRRDEMGRFVATPGQRILGWLATAVMAAAVAAMFIFRDQ